MAAAAAAAAASLVLPHFSSKSSHASSSHHQFYTDQTRHTYHTSCLSVKASSIQAENHNTLVATNNDKSQLVEKSVKVLKNAAKTRKVESQEVLEALSKIAKAKLDPSDFFEILGGTESPGNTWMLIFTANGGLKKGSYFPVTAVQRFDAAGKRIENGVYLGPFGCLTFEGRLSWKNRILAFIFESIRIKVGSLGPLQLSLGNKGDDREPTTKDPFFIWFYVDEEIAVAQGRGGGTAFWCRCRRIQK